MSFETDKIDLGGVIQVVWLLNRPKITRNYKKSLKTFYLYSLENSQQKLPESSKFWLIWIQKNTCNVTFVIIGSYNILNEQLVDNILANVEIQTADLWCRKQLLYQLSHNHFPRQVCSQESRIFHVGRRFVDSALCWHPRKWPPSDAWSTAFWLS